MPYPAVSSLVELEKMTRSRIRNPLGVDVSIFWGPTRLLISQKHKRNIAWKGGFIQDKFC